MTHTHMNNIQPPWYTTALRWGQTNITESDPPTYDLAFWLDHWQRTRVQGIIVNASGIVAYYPTRFDLQYRAEHLGQRDLFGDVAKAARSIGLVILARMDSNRVTREFADAHPDWMSVDREGNILRAQDRFMPCVNGPYYHEYLPEVMREIIERYQVEGFTDNSWAGPGRKSICYCRHCRASFGRELPAKVDLDDAVYRDWMRWSYTRRIHNWELNNRVTRAAGGEHCLWLGMVNANPFNSHAPFVDLRAIGSRTPVLMCDHQSRDVLHGFEQNASNGKLLHAVSSDAALIPESMAMYVRGDKAFRIAANPAAESRLWMIEGIAGGLAPWWHHIGAHREDGRQHDTAEPVMRWHEANEPLLRNREPIADVGLVWSHENIDFYGRDAVHERLSLPWRGWTRALVRARMPYLPVHADDISRYAGRLKTLVLANVGLLTSPQADAIRAFAAAGGRLIVTGQTGCFAESHRRHEPLLGDLLGYQFTGQTFGATEERADHWEKHALHSYLRVDPDWQTGQSRHPILQRFAKTNLLPFGGLLEEIQTTGDVLATYVPSFPVYPPEFSWMREPRTTVPGIVVAGQHVYLPADIDRCHGRGNLPDHGELLAALLRWTVPTPSLEVTGPGTLDCHLYRQGDRHIVHIVNLTGANLWPGYLEEHTPVGPVTIRVRAGQTTMSHTLEQITDHALVVL